MKSAIFIGLIAALPLGACGSDGMANGGSRGAVGAVGSYQTPPPNPQEALLNPQQPLPNGSAPLTNDQAPLPNPEAPVPSGEPGAGLGNACSSICTGTGICSGPCQDRCAALGAVLGQCSAPISSFIQCVRNGSFDLVCDPRGRLVVPDGASCLDEAQSAVDCLGLRNSDIAGPPPSGNNRGRGRTNDAGLPLP